MKKLFMAALLSSLFTTSALAAEATITVTANVDPVVELRNADGSLLSQTLQMGYTPGVGLDGIDLPTRIFSNDQSKGVKVRLASSAQLTHISDTSVTAIPLRVSLNGSALSTTETTLDANTLFNDTTAGAPGQSVILPLKIEQTTKAPVTTAGTYQGLVQLILAQGS
ncbi:CS1 type fimbrial major subunit [Pantoea sp.]|uniref:CS1 type fimbrial major subunit n=1 Tax=Pantoea sp. TaxID=69393 RepID=UPI0031D031D2